MKVAIASLFLLTFFGNAYAAPNKEEYELQERCGKRAGEYFASGLKTRVLFTENDKTTNVVTYRNHYNGKLNKCFILVTIMETPKSEKESNLNHRDLSDILNKDNSLKIMPKDKQTSSISLTEVTEELWDINENSLYGIFSKIDDNDKPSQCKALSKACLSETEWRLFVEPYMKE
jgi:hypothetical protein